MTIILEDISMLRGGLRKIVAVGDLPIEVAQSMGIHATTVYLTRDSLQHINEKHPDISDTDLLLSCLAIKDGLVMQEQSKTNAYICSYVESYSEVRYVATLKVAAPDREVLMTSFRRSRKRQTKAFQRRCNTVKTHS